MCICCFTCCQLIRWLFCCQCLQSTENDDKFKFKYKPKSKSRQLNTKTPRSSMATIKTQPYNEFIKNEDIYIVVTLSADIKPETYLQTNGYQLTTDPLGKGTFGQVFKAYKTTGKQELIACKVIEMNKKRQKDILHELYHQKVLNYQYIIEMFAAFVIEFPVNDHYKTNAYLMMAYSSDGDLKKVMEKNKRPFNEETAKKYFAQISLAIRYLHKNLIAHRDLKLDNVLLFPSISNPSIKECRLTDFGLTEPGYTKVIGQVWDNKSVGTRQYMAPEVLCINIRNAQNKDIEEYRVTPVDCWALGVILYRMMTNEFPYDVGPKPKRPLTDTYIKFIEKVLDMQKKGEMLKNSHLKKGSEALDLIEWCLQSSVIVRLNIDAIIAHKWLRGETSITEAAKQHHKSRSKHKTASHR